MDVLALAGGTTLTAGNEIQITRGSANAEPIPKSILVHYSRATDPDAVKQAIVNPGDTVLVKRAGIVYVLGAVTRPGGYVMQEEGTLNVLQAISLANGTALAAKTGTIHILRRDDHGAVADIRLSYKKLIRGQSSEVQLHASGCAVCADEQSQGDLNQWLLDLGGSSLGFHLCCPLVLDKSD